MRAWLALAVAVSIGCVGAARSGDAIDTDVVGRLVELVAERLRVIGEVARYKWNARMPAADPAREAALLDAMLTQAAELGLEPQFARAVVEGQLDASRASQQAAFERWRQSDQPPFADTRDLANDLRPALDRLTHELLVAARDARGVLETCAARTQLADVPVAVANTAVWRTAVAPLIPQDPCTR